MTDSDLFMTTVANVVLIDGVDFKIVEVEK